MTFKKKSNILESIFITKKSLEISLNLTSYSPLSNTGNVLNKRNIGPLGQKLIKITHLISVTEDQVSFFE